MKNQRLRELLKTARRNPALMVGFLMVMSLVVIAILTEQIAPYWYNDADMSVRLQTPGSRYLFGTDEYGRDVYSRVIYGVRLALEAAILGTLIELAIGVVIGLASGFIGGVVDRVLMFIADLFWSLPTIVIAMAIVMLLGKTLENVIIALALAGWPKYSRIVRAKTMSLKNMAFVETGAAFGESKWSLMFIYILPNIIPSIIVMASVSMPGMITSTATLSFLGMGSQPPSPDWGLAISRSASQIYLAPWLAIFPGIALVYTVFGFSLLGEGLRDLVDPRLRMQ